MDDLKNLGCLLPKTKTVLLKLVESCEFLENYVLVGDSALTMRLCHRRSEDLDFFTYGDSFSKKEIFDFIQHFQ
jgi:predicted nucleotidyltransferase component of viral defense system